jgi:hypothetical protein
MTVIFFTFFRGAKKTSQSFVAGILRLYAKLRAPPTRQRLESIIAQLVRTSRIDYGVRGEIR